MNQLRACRPAVWLALAAMLLGAFAPTVSRALAAARSDGAPMVEVCTSEGPRWVPLAPTSADMSTADASHGQESAPSLDHCPFCLLVAERLGPPPAASMHFFNAESGLARPDAQALFFVSRPSTVALPRGPPRRA
ncbi:DUF2946 family protein [Curvibacter delicatus]|uniref:DUF2946 family protein n=1 Tax=Curvibacter delicatus TaxID=80879 RepID=UPI0012ED8221|nr:DUF2946 family protein [Curvibacter delicatus]